MTSSSDGHDLARALQHLVSTQDKPPSEASIRRAAEEAVVASHRESQEGWWQQMLEAGQSLGLSLRLVDGTVDEAFDAVCSGALVATVAPQDRKENWIVATGRSGRRFDVRIVPGDGRRQKWSIRRFGRGCGHRKGEPLRFVVMETHDMQNVPAEALAPPTPLARLRALLRPERSDIWVVLVFALFVGILTLATPLAVEALVNTVAFGRFLQPVVVLSLMLLAFLSFSAALRGVQTFAVEILQRRLFARIASDVAWRLPRVRGEGLNGAYTPELANRFFDVVTVQKVSAGLLLDGMNLVLTTLIGMVVLGFYHPWLLGFDFVLLVLIGLVVFVLGRGAVQSSVKESKQKYRMAAWLEDIARCPTAFKMDGGAEFAAGRADELTADYLLYRRKHFGILMRQILFALGLQAVASTVLLGMGGWLVISGQLTLGQLVAAELIVALIVGAFAKLGKHMESYYDLLAAVDKLGVLVDLPLERQTGSIHSATGPASLQLHGVSYARGGRRILTAVDFDIPAGTSLGITGPPASGKSTIADLLYGLRSPDSGHLVLDGLDPRHLRPDVLRRHVALVRDIEVIDGTILENVQFGRAGCSAAKASEALAAVDLLDEVLALPNGLETTINSGGSPLSGSQLRRLMLARALAGAPRVLVVDGLLDAVDDGLAERLLTRLVDSGSTLVVVSGRRMILDHCDRVFDTSLESIEPRSSVMEESR